MWELGYEAEHWRIDAFGLWCWRRLLRVPWTTRRSNQSILKEISPEYSLEGLMLKLKLQYFGYLMQRSDSFEKTLMLGKIEGGRTRGRQRIRMFDAISNSRTWVWVSSRSWWWIGKPGVLPSMGLKRVGNDWASELKKQTGQNPTATSEVLRTKAGYCTGSVHTASPSGWADHLSHTSSQTYLSAPTPTPFKEPVPPPIREQARANVSYSCSLVLQHKSQ